MKCLTLVSAFGIAILFACSNCPRGVNNTDPSCPNYTSYRAGTTQYQTSSCYDSAGNYICGTGYGTNGYNTGYGSPYSSGYGTGYNTGYGTGYSQTGQCYSQSTGQYYAPQNGVCSYY